MTTQTTMSQPASLVQYGHAVLVSTSGKRPNKVPLLSFSKSPRMSHRIFPTPTLKISSTLFYPQESTQWTNNNFGTPLII